MSLLTRRRLEINEVAPRPSRPLTSAIVLPVIALLGLAVTAMMVGREGSGGLESCGIGGCSAVTSSRFSEVFGVRLTAIGLFYFGVMTVVSLTAAVGRAPGPRMLRAAGVVVGLVAVVILVWIEFVVIGSLCLWCTLVHLVVLVLVLVEALDWALRAEPEGWRDRMAFD